MDRKEKKLCAAFYYRCTRPEAAPPHQGFHFRQCNVVVVALDTMFQAGIRHRKLQRILRRQAEHIIQAFPTHSSVAPEFDAPGAPLPYGLFRKMAGPRR